jgi:HAD superfamily hydrolase (TIGR01509 family)
MVRGVLLDVDGTLLDSNDAHAHAFEEALAEQGYPVPFAEVRRLIGKGSEKLLMETAGLDKEQGPGKAVGERKKELFKTRYLTHLGPARGARELLERMRRCGLRLVVATSAGKEELEGLLKAAGVLGLTDDQTSASEVERSKPDPDIIQAALKKIRLPASEVLMLGDTPYDVEAAAKAGVRTVALRCGGWADADLCGAIAIYDDPADLLAHYEESPFASAGPS